MASPVCLIFVLLLLAASAARCRENEFVKCQSSVKKWAAASLNQEEHKHKHALQDLLFFLHIPRTGGRTYFHCFLRKLYATYLECPRSYDKLRFDPSKPNCRLMVTHDDYSMMSRLPKERTSVVTILRKPVERVLSTYEFSVEVAARFLVHPNLTSATQMTGRIRPKSSGVSTLDIWPWKYLVPWMREDLFARRDGRKHGDSKDFQAINTPYTIERIVMPLHEFIDDPVAHEIIHNGATFQVAGLTNNSCLAGAHEVRHCVRKYRSLGEYVLEVAKKRLDDMLYVGLTEDHKGSATMFANVVGSQVLSQLQALSPRDMKAGHNETEIGSSFTDFEQDTDQFQHSTNREAGRISSTGNVKVGDGTMTVEQLMETYESCIFNLRKAQARRRTSSLKRIAPANFSKEARLKIPEMVLQKIISLNSLDVELYKHAQEIYTQQGKRLVEKLVEVERQQSSFITYEGVSWSGLLFGISVLLAAVLIFMIVKGKYSFMVSDSTISAKCSAISAQCSAAAGGPRPKATYVTEVGYTPTDIAAAMHTMTLSPPDTNWYMDTGATAHMTSSSDQDASDEV